MEDIVQNAYAKMAGMDPPRRVPRVRVRIVNKSTGHCVAGHALERGENIIEVYADEVKGIEAQVEDIASHQLKVAREKLDRAVASWKADGFDPKTAPFSLESMIRDVTGRDPKPFEAVEVLGPAEAPGKKNKGEPAAS